LDRNVRILTNVQGGPKKWHKVYGTIILQLYITESCGFQQNILKEILYMTKVSELLKNRIIFYVPWSIKTCHCYFFDSSMKHWPI